MGTRYNSKLIQSHPELLYHYVLAVDEGVYKRKLEVYADGVYEQFRVLSVSILWTRNLSFNSFLINSRYHSFFNILMAIVIIDYFFNDFTGEF